jgi:hypothetical protein
MAVKLKNNDLHISLSFMAALLILTLVPFFAANIILPKANAAIQVDGGSGSDMEYAVAIFPPKTSFVDTVKKIKSAQGVMIKDSRYDFVTYSASKSANYADSLYKQGAILVLKPRLITSCYTPDI